MSDIPAQSPVLLAPMYSGTVAPFYSALDTPATGLIFLLFLDNIGCICIATNDIVAKLSFPLGVIQMDQVIETNDEPRKEWAAPELKKIDIEEITAGGTGSTDDGLYGES